MNKLLGDLQPMIRVSADYIENIFQLMRLVSTPETVAFYDAQFNGCSIRYGDMKKQLAEDMVAFIAPIREKALDLQTNTDYLKQVMKLGKEKARSSASATLSEARKKMGIDFY